jgi:hypothetical protein
MSDPEYHCQLAGSTVIKHDERYPVLEVIADPHSFHVHCADHHADLTRAEAAALHGYLSRWLGIPVPVVLRHYLLDRARELDGYLDRPCAPGMPCPAKGDFVVALPDTNPVTVHMVVHDPAGGPTLVWVNLPSIDTVQALDHWRDGGWTYTPRINKPLVD